MWPVSWYIVHFGRNTLLYVELRPPSDQWTKPMTNDQWGLVHWSDKLLEIFLTSSANNFGKGHTALIILVASAISLFMHYIVYVDNLTVWNANWAMHYSSIYPIGWLSVGVAHKLWFPNLLSHAYNQTAVLPRKPVCVTVDHGEWKPVLTRLLRQVGAWYRTPPDIGEINSTYIFIMPSKTLNLALVL